MKRFSFHFDSIEFIVPFRRCNTGCGRLKWCIFILYVRSSNVRESVGHSSIFYNNKRELTRVLDWREKTWERASLFSEHSTPWSLLILSAWEICRIYAISNLEKKKKWFSERLIFCWIFFTTCDDTYVKPLLVLMYLFRVVYLKIGYERRQSRFYSLNWKDNTIVWVVFMASNHYHIYYWY